MGNRLLLISFFGSSGSGKSTSFEFAKKLLKEKGFRVIRFDVACPLRLIQSVAYECFGLPSPGAINSSKFKQDGQLMSFLARHFQKHFYQNLKRRYGNIMSHEFDRPLALINSDCRNNAYKTLKNLGFVFVRIHANKRMLKARRKDRGDLTPYNYAHQVEAINFITEQYRINNNGTKYELRKKVGGVVAEILKNQTS